MGRKKDENIAREKNIAAATSARMNLRQQPTAAVEAKQSERSVTIQEPESKTGESTATGGKRGRTGSLTGSGGSTPIPSPMKPSDSVAGARGGLSKKARKRWNKKSRIAGSAGTTPQSSPMKPSDSVAEAGGGICDSFWHEYAHKLCGGDMAILCKHMAVGDTIHIEEISCVLSRCADPIQPFCLRDKTCTGYLGDSRHTQQYNRRQTHVCQACYDRKQSLHLSRRGDDLMNTEEEEEEATVEDIFLRAGDNTVISVHEIKNMTAETLQRKLIATRNALAPVLNHAGFIRGIQAPRSKEEEEAMRARGKRDSEAVSGSPPPGADSTGGNVDSADSMAENTEDPEASAVSKAPLIRYEFPEDLLIGLDFSIESEPAPVVAGATASASSDRVEGKFGSLSVASLDATSQSSEREVFGILDKLYEFLTEKRRASADQPREKAKWPPPPESPHPCPDGRNPLRALRFILQLSVIEGWKGRPSEIITPEMTKAHSDKQKGGGAGTTSSSSTGSSSRYYTRSQSNATKVSEVQREFAKDDLMNRAEDLVEAITSFVNHSRKHDPVGKLMLI